MRQSGIVTSLGTAHKACIWICFALVVLNIILGIAGFVYIGASLHKEKFLANAQDSDAVIHYLGENLHSRPINDIVLAVNGKCPKYTSRVLGKWPGSIKACKCPAEVKKTKCTSKDLKSGCSDFEIPPKDISFWRDKQLCTGTISKAVFAKKSCSADYKKCSDQYTCVPRSENCPIYDIKIQAKTVRLEQGFQKLDLDAQNVLVFSSAATKDDTPLMHFDVSMTQEACIPPNRIPQSEPKIFFGLLNNPLNGCDRLGKDEDYTQPMDSLNQKDVLTQNRLYDELTRALPGYDSFVRDNKYHLQAKFAIKIKNETCSHVDWRGLRPAVNALSMIRKFLKYLVIVAVVAGLIQLIFLVLVILSIMKCNCLFDWSKIYTWTGCLFVFFHVLWLSLFLAIALITLSLGLDLRERRRPLIPLIGAKCFEVNKYNEIVDLYTNRESTFIIYGGFALITFIAILYILEIFVFSVLLCMLSRARIPRSKAREYFGQQLNCFRIDEEDEKRLVELEEQRRARGTPTPPPPPQTYGRGSSYQTPDRGTYATQGRSSFRGYEYNRFYDDQY
eukprot:TRINITY_DN4012_c0_g1_i2.p1 TRINITY_DN4012_c0_g1~~TRINITY_DN4012_c0_g1_i2.p1  ORF type:complete len:560 (+),score=115.70 TRINITY_DN4012_c0_g1_i2:1675-3354(+)